MFRAVFLDRDGTINKDFGYIKDPLDIELIEGASLAISLFRERGFKVIVVSNQSVVGRGLASLKDVEACNLEIQRKLELACPSSRLDLVLFSPDAPSSQSRTRKPKTGLLEEVSKHFEVDFSSSYLIGDKITDIEFGINASIPEQNCYLVMTGSGIDELSNFRKSISLDRQINFNISENLLFAAREIVSRS